MGGALLLALANAAIGACALTQASVVQLSDHNVRLRDIVSPTCVQTTKLQGDTIVAALPRGVHRFALSQPALVALTHRRMPALELHSADARRPVVFEIQQPEPMTAPCYAAKQPIGAAQAIDGDRLVETACAGHRNASLTEYSRDTRVLRAREPIAAGAYLGPLSVPQHRYPDAGDTLVLVSNLGATRVERPVTAAQAAPYGDTLFVQDADGKIFKTRLARPTAEAAP